MVEAKDQINKLYWIVDHETLHWAPGKPYKVKFNLKIGRVIRDLPNELHLECLITNDSYAIEKGDAIEVHPSCLGKTSSLETLFKSFYRRSIRLT